LRDLNSRIQDIWKNLNVLALELVDFLIRVITPNFKLFNCAVVQHNDILSLDVVERSRVSSRLSILEEKQDIGGTGFKQLVREVSLDLLAGNFEIPDIVKVDIEGAKVLALLCSEKIIVARKTQFLIKVDEGNGDKMRFFFDAYSCFVDEVWRDSFLIPKK
jgi:FkbM family methyltransferase